MEDQIATVQHWSNEKEPKQAKSKDEVIRRNLDRIHIAATPPPSNPSRHSQVSPIKKKFKIIGLANFHIPMTRYCESSAAS